MLVLKKTNKCRLIRLPGSGYQRTPQSVKHFHSTWPIVQMCLATVTLTEIIQNKHHATAINFISSSKQNKQKKQCNLWLLWLTPQQLNGQTFEND